MFLSRHAAVVQLLVRDRTLARSMSRYLADRIEQAPNVHIHYQTSVRELVGDHGLRAIVTENSGSGERARIEARALFVFIGADPNTSWLQGELAMDDRGFLLTGRQAGPAEMTRAVDPAAGGHSPALLETNRPGVFAAGDVRSGSVKRVAAAVGEGAMAVSLVLDCLERTWGQQADL
jgi:thioredoxin reductase (NADPH)